MATLNRFISRSTDKCLPFFDVLRSSRDFKWSDKCEEAFQALKDYMGKPPLLSRLVTEEILFLYLAVSAQAVSAALVREEVSVQRPVYYISKRMLDPETKYPVMEKLALALVISSKKLRPYFQAHSIHVFTSYSLRQILQKPEVSGRLMQWSVELDQFDVTYKGRTAIKGQALADFVLELSGKEKTKEPELVPEQTSDNPENLNEESWSLHVDGSTNEEGSRVGMVLVSPEGDRFPAVLKLGFQASNNEAKYEVLLARIRLAKELGADVLRIFSDSQLVVRQVIG